MGGNLNRQALEEASSWGSLMQLPAALSLSLCCYLPPVRYLRSMLQRWGGPVWRFRPRIRLSYRDGVTFVMSRFWLGPTEGRSQQSLLLLDGPSRGLCKLRPNSPENERCSDKWRCRGGLPHRADQRRHECQTGQSAKLSPEQVGYFTCARQPAGER